MKACLLFLFLFLLYFPAESANLEHLLDTLITNWEGPRAIVDLKSLTSDKLGNLRTGARLSHDLFDEFLTHIYGNGDPSTSDYVLRVLARRVSGIDGEMHLDQLVRIIFVVTYLSKEINGAWEQGLVLLKYFDRHGEPSAQNHAYEGRQILLPGKTSEGCNAALQ